MGVKFLSLCSFALLCIAATQNVFAQQVKQKLIITSLLSAPYLDRGDDGDGTKYVGFVEDLAEEIADTLDSEFQINLVKDGKYGAPDPNTPGGWTGMVGELIRKEAHLAIAPLTISAARAKVIDFTTPFQEVRLSILMQEPPEEEDESDATFTFLEPLNGLCWLVIFISLVGILILSLVVEWSFKNPDTRPAGFINFLRQDAICSPVSVTGKLLRLVFWIFVLILVSAYTASFAAQRLADSEEHIAEQIDSIEELADSGDEVNYGIIEGGTTSVYFRTSDMPIYKRMYSTMEDRDNFITNYTEGLERVREGNFAFLMESPNAEYVISQSPCDLVVVGDEFGPNKGYAIASAKDSPLSDRVNLAILEMKDNGKLEQLLDKWWNEGECAGDSEDDEDNDEEDFDQLHLSELAGVFYFLLGGIGLVIIVWILESRLVNKAG